MKKLTSKQKTEYITEVLYTIYPEAACSLEFCGDPFRLLVMSRLSAQCTDARVNIVSKELFAAYPDVYSMAQAPLEEIERLVRPCGLFRTKAKSIKEMSVMLVEKFDGKVPSDMDSLLLLPGVGRKIANLMRGDCFGFGGIVADTHCIRLTCRFGLCTAENPLAVEKALDKLIPENLQSGYCHRMVYFGREYCKAQNPRCDECPIKQKHPEICVYRKSGKNKTKGTSK